MPQTDESTADIPRIAQEEAVLRSSASPTVPGIAHGKNWHILPQGKLDMMDRW